MTNETEITNATTGSVPAQTVTHSGTDPFEQSAQGKLGTYVDYLMATSAAKISSSNNSTLSSVTASRTLFKGHQLKPLPLFFNSPNRRILIGDEVGLGKTIEAGFIMNELRARDELRNVLVICPKALQLKWKKELSEKFGLEFTIYPSNADLLKALDHSSTSGGRAIINYERVRMRKQYESKQEQQSNAPVNLVDYLGQSQTRFGLVVYDEAHRMRNDETQTYKGAQIILSRADAAVFLTATPVMTDVKNLFNLLHLLDSERFTDLQVFKNILMETRPFLDAIAALNQGQPLSTIKENLAKAEVEVIYTVGDDSYAKKETLSQIYEGNSQYDEIMNLLDSKDSPDTRAALQVRFQGMCPTSSIFTRTRKREVTTDMSQAERKVHLLWVSQTYEERTTVDDIILDYLFSHLREELYSPFLSIEELKMLLHPKYQMALMQIERQLASNVHAYLSTWEDLDKGVDAFAQSDDSKTDCLIDLYQASVRAGGPRKMVVFAVFKKTAEYLRIRLRKRGYNSLVIHGDVDHREEIIETFRTNPSIHFLIATEVIGEGLDLQFCSAIVNVDYPWNPMVIEQRIGRLDRFGQHSPIIHIYNMVVNYSIQEKIYKRLLSRIDVFKESVGELETILSAVVDGLPVATLIKQYEHDFNMGKLTEEEVLHKTDEICRAVANQRLAVTQLNKDLEDTHTHDAYFCNEVDRILGNHIALMGGGLHGFIEAILDEAVPGCIIEEKGDGLNCLHIYGDASGNLVSFMREYQPSGSDDVLFRTFIQKVEGEESLDFTFDQKKAFEDRSLEFVNMFHPLVVACVTYYYSSHRPGSYSSVFSFSVPLQGSLLPGVYYMALYEVTIRREIQGVAKSSTELYPVLYDVDCGEIVPDHRLAEELYQYSTENASEWTPDNHLMEPELIARVKNAIEASVKTDMEARRLLLVQVAETEQSRRTARTREYYEAILHNKHHTIKQWEFVLEKGILTQKERACLESAIRITKAGITRTHDQMIEALAKIQPGSVAIDQRILTLSLVMVTDDTAD